MAGVAKSIKALNHKDTKAQRKAFLSAGRSLSRPRKNFVSPCLCCSLLFRALCDAPSFEKITVGKVILAFPTISFSAKVVVFDLEL